MAETRRYTATEMRRCVQTARDIDAAIGRRALKPEGIVVAVRDEEHPDRYFDVLAMLTQAAADLERLTRFRAALIEERDKSATASEFMKEHSVRSPTATMMAANIRALESALAQLDELFPHLAAPGGRDGD